MPRCEQIAASDRAIALLCSHYGVIVYSWDSPLPAGLPSDGGAAMLSFVSLVDIIPAALLCLDYDSATYWFTQHRTD